MGQKTNLQMGQKTNPKNSSTTIELQLQPLWRILFTKPLPKINWKTKIYVSHMSHIIHVTDPNPKYLHVSIAPIRMF